VFMPFSIVVNTDKNQYYIRQLGSFKLEVIFDPAELFYVKFNLLFLGFTFYPLRSGSEIQKPKKEKEKKKKKNRKGFSRTTIQLLLSIIRQNLLSFKVKHFILSLDTGNVITNAYLYPIGVMASGNKVEININNEDGNRLIALIENSPFHMIKATLISFFKHKFNK
jgi:hypothetical protein